MKEKKRGPGRPRMATGTAKVGVFTLKLSAEERVTIEFAAKRDGKAVSQWAREALLATAARSRA